MRIESRVFSRVLLIGLMCAGCYARDAQSGEPGFKVIAFYTGREDLAHISFDHEANRWFPKMGAKYIISLTSAPRIGTI
jgi:hypothetical protein